MNSKINKSVLLAASACAALLAACDSVKDVIEQPTIDAPVLTGVLQGTVSGLGTRRPVVLQNNGVSECLNRDDPSVAEGTLVECRYLGTLGQETVAFSMGARPIGTPYNVTVKTQPFGKVCTVANGTGTIGTADAAPITVTCANDPAVARFAVSGTIAPAVASLPGAKVTLTTEEGEWDIPAAGLTSFNFPDAIFNSQVSLPIFRWWITASYLDGDTVNNCNVVNGTNADVPTGPVSNVQVTACNFPVTAAVTYQAETGQPTLTMNPGGMQLALRHQRTGVDEQTLEVSSYSSTPRAFADPVQSNPAAVYELVVTRQPEGHACVIGSASEAVRAGSVMLVDPTDTTHSWWTARNVRCRVVPALERQLRGIYQLTTRVAGVDTVRRNFMAFFEDGTFVYGAHGTGVNAYSNSGVLHGFYNYNNATGSIAFYPLTGNTSANPTGTQNAGFANPGSTATLTGVVKTPGPESQITGRINATTEWVLKEPRQSAGQMMGAWASEDGRRIWVFNPSTYNGFHAGVNGLANVQDGCFNIEDPTAPSGYYTRRGNATTCSLGTGMFTLDFPAATTTPRLPLNFYGRWPAAGTQLDGRPSSPVNYDITAGTPDTLRVQETLNGLVTLNGSEIYPPVVLKRFTSN